MIAMTGTALLVTFLSILGVIVIIPPLLDILTPTMVRFSYRWDRITEKRHQKNVAKHKKHVNQFLANSAKSVSDDYFDKVKEFGDGVDSRSR